MGGRNSVAAELQLWEGRSAKQKENVVSVKMLFEKPKGRTELLEGMFRDSCAQWITISLTSQLSSGSQGQRLPSKVIVTAVRAKHRIHADRRP